MRWIAVPPTGQTEPLAFGFHRCVAYSFHPPITDDTFIDLLPSIWPFQPMGIGEATCR